MRRSISRSEARLVGAAVAVVLTLLLPLLLLSPAHSAPSMGVKKTFRIAAVTNGGCTGPSAPSPATGTLALIGSSTPLPSVAGVPVTVDYFYTESQGRGGGTIFVCFPASATGPTGSGGSLSLALPIPPNDCLPTSSVCDNYTGPFGPLSYNTSGPPAGYMEQDPNGSTSPGTIEWIADLYSVTLNVTGVDVVSTNAPVDVSLTAWDGRGGRTIGALHDVWTLSGLDWMPVSQMGPDAVVFGFQSGWIGTLYATVTVTYGSTTESAQSPTLFLVPVPTRVFSASPSAAPVDPGVPVTFSVTGSGAAGYAYSVTVDPGLGAGPVTAPCESTRLANGTANLTCQVQAAYPQSGVAIPIASITNGYSTAMLDLAPLAVHPVEQVTLGAPTLVTYPDRPIAITVAVENGTGSAPYGPACLTVVGGSPITCRSQNGTGPSWLFDVTFGQPGNYELQASVTDRFGENVSATAYVAVASYLTARANGSSSLTLFANRTASLSVVVAGGVLPIIVWWNLSRTTVFSCPELLDFDGTISCPYEPLSVGRTNLTVTVRDALGTESSVVFRLNVTAPPVPPTTSGGSIFTGTSGGILIGLLAALGVGALVVAWDVRRRRQTGGLGGPENRVEDNELERMARGREHLLAQADLTRPQRPDELLAGWTGPPVAPDEWAEWIAALVADGSLVPSRGPGHRVQYRRAPLPLPTPTIQFDPTVLSSRPPPVDDGPDPLAEPRDPQGGG